MPGLPDLQASLNAALPQTQCTRCGYPDCAAYAQAIADSTAEINQCPPGGAEGVARLAALTGRPVLPLNPANGIEGPRLLAVIDEDWCIGCTLCLDACPTDAILGGNKRMHTVIAPYCTGCELCIPVCPVDCIALENASASATGWQAWSASQAEQALVRYKIHSKRVSSGAGQAPKTSEIEALEVPQATDNAQRKRAVIDAALARARQRKP